MHSSRIIPDCPPTPVPTLAHGLSRRPQFEYMLNRVDVLATRIGGLEGQVTQLQNGGSHAGWARAGLAAGISRAGVDGAGPRLNSPHRIANRFINAFSSHRNNNNSNRGYGGNNACGYAATEDTKSGYAQSTAYTAVTTAYTTTDYPGMSDRASLANTTMTGTTVAARHARDVLMGS